MGVPNWHWTRQPDAEATRAKISAAAKSRVFTDERRFKVHTALIGNRNAPEYPLGAISKQAGRLWIKTETGQERLHRRVYEDTYGSIPDGRDVHHLDGDPLNNAPANLQALAHGQHSTQTQKSRWNRERE